MSEAFTPTTTSLSRVWLIEGGARADHTPVFQSCLKAMGVSQGQGDIEKIECPSPDAFGEFVEVGVIKGAQERETSSLVGRYPLNEESILMRLARQRCELDFQVNLGDCQDPRNFADFKKKLIRETVFFTNYSTDDIGALSSDENAVVNETVDTSSKSVYEVLPLSFTRRADDIIDNPGIDAVICDRPSCGSCDDESDGCETVFILANNGPGSPGTAPDLLYSVDKAVTFAADDITSLLSSEAANGVACVDTYVVVVSNDSASIHYKLQSDVVAGTAGQWVEIATGIVAGGEPNDIWSTGSQAFIVGDSGYVYTLDDPASGVSAVDAGVATSENLNAVHALDENFAVAVGENDAVIYTPNGVNWQAPTATPSSGANLNCVWVWSERVWWAGSSNGQLWYTTDQGETWTQDTLPGTSYTAIWDIAFATPSIGYLGVARTIGGTARGQILRTYSGGGGGGTEGGWTILPEQIGQIPNNDLIRAIAACQYDVNFIVGTGTADNGTDGIIVVGDD